MRLTVLATCALNQWALDFHGNVERIIESITLAKKAGAKYRMGPELEICGYSCEDHFLENDTIMHSWEGLCAILAQPHLTDGILCDIGMPVLFRSGRYNCRVYVMDGKILLIRPKMALADDGNYREPRWFARWTKLGVMEQLTLPPMVRELTGQVHVPIGDGVVETLDTCIGSEMCEELFAVNSSHVRMGLDGVEIFSNGSGSHHTLRKLHQRVDLMRMATSKHGGIYMYANQQGCDGNRLYFDGSAMIVVNGEVVAQGAQFSMEDVEVVTAVVDLDAVASYRTQFGSSAAPVAAAASIPRVRVPLTLSAHEAVPGSSDFLQRVRGGPSRPRKVRFHTPEQEICLGPACWLWDYLRRSNAGGFFLPLSGGIDSSSTATIVGAMCTLAIHECEKGNKQVIADVMRMTRAKSVDEMPKSATELAGILFHTCYMGTVNSSKETRERAKSLAADIGAYHLDIDIDSFVDSAIKLFSSYLGGLVPKFAVNGGTRSENLALQNIQARCRMVLSYLFASLLPWARCQLEKKEQMNGFLLVLSSANVDEALRGYMTKYDCSSGDLNPIGGISKSDLRRFVGWASGEQKAQEAEPVEMDELITSGITYPMASLVRYPSLRFILNATPTAELEPITSTHQQSDEEDMGMSYNELTLYGSLRKVQRCGPVSMFTALVSVWRHYEPAVVAQKVKDFFRFYGINRHKMTTITPAYHAERYSPDDNRFDLRPFLYPSWRWQFDRIDRQVQLMNGVRTKASI